VAVPNPIMMKEFFTFIREIFYYDQDMDAVDFNLATDVLEILNEMLKKTPF
jgi:hypothetical protein